MKINKNRAFLAALLIAVSSVATRAADSFDGSQTGDGVLPQERPLAYRANVLLKFLAEANTRCYRAIEPFSAGPKAELDQSAPANERTVDAEALGALENAVTARIKSVYKVYYKRSTEVGPATMALDRYREKAVEALGQCTDASRWAALEIKKFEQSPLPSRAGQEPCLTYRQVKSATTVEICFDTLMGMRPEEIRALGDKIEGTWAFLLQQDPSGHSREEYRAKNMSACRRLYDAVKDLQNEPLPSADFADQSLEQAISGTRKPDVRLAALSELEERIFWAGLSQQ